MPASKEQRHSRYLKKVGRRRAAVSDQPKRTPDEKQVALSAAAAQKTKALADLRADYEPRIAELEAEYAEKRRRVWAEYEERKGLLRQATLLEVAK